MINQSCYATSDTGERVRNDVV